MADEPPLALQGELLDDFFAEFDELLTNVRQGLVQLETQIPAANPDAGVIETLFRQLHTLKGICGIAGLRSGEELAHAMEDLLRALKKGQVRLSTDMVDTLLVGAQRLGAVGTALRLEQAMPAIADILDQLHDFLPATATPGRPSSAVNASGGSAAESTPAAGELGHPLFKASFVPSSALEQKGVNVATVRARLQAAGAIVSATPVVKGKGAIVFEFIVGLREPPADLAGWAADGVTLTPVAPAEPAMAKPETGAKAGFAQSLSLAPSHLVRVDLSHLDDLMRVTGEMVISRSRLDDRITKLHTDDTALREINLALMRSLREMRQVIARIRMVPVAEIFTRMPFVVRDLTRESGRKARVTLEGRQTEIDKFLVERLKEPLLHLVRNAFAHGIEPPAERMEAGKPAEAVIALKAFSQGESVVIEVRDDGRGIDPVKVVARARAHGLAVPDVVDSAALLKILCAAGFSTRDEADLAAGRGVGMAVVENTIRELGGSLALASAPGVGTVFTLKLPLTLSITEALIVTAGEQACAIPQAAVDEIVQVPREDYRLVGQTGVIPYRGGLLPLRKLRALFRLPEASTPALTVLVLAVERGAVGLVVDRVLSQREIVIRPLADALLKVPGVSGATELGDGRPILILDPAELTRGVIRPPHESDRPEKPLSENPAP